MHVYILCGSRCLEKEKRQYLHFPQFHSSVLPEQSCLLGGQLLSQSNKSTNVFWLCMKYLSLSLNCKKIGCHTYMHAMHTDINDVQGVNIKECLCVRERWRNVMSCVCVKLWTAPWQLQLDPSAPKWAYAGASIAKWFCKIALRFGNLTAAVSIFYVTLWDAYARIYALQVLTVRRRWLRWWVTAPLWVNTSN